MAKLPDHICDKQVYQDLFRRLSKSVRDFLYYKSGDLEVANDLTQDAFVRLWEKCKDVPFDKAKSFVFTVANNLFLNNVKHKKVRLKYREQQTTSLSTNETPAFQLEQKEFQRKLESAIANLPEGQREVFLLNRINKMTYSEIATHLEVSQKAIEKRMSKALKKLKDVLYPTH